MKQKLKGVQLKDFDFEHEFKLVAKNNSDKEIGHASYSECPDGLCLTSIKSNKIGYGKNILCTSAKKLKNLHGNLTITTAPVTKDSNRYTQHDLKAWYRRRSFETSPDNPHIMVTTLDKILKTCKR